MSSPRIATQHADDAEYLDEGPSDATTPPVVLLHGMLGGLSNWYDTVHATAEAGFRVIVPLLPIYEMPLRRANLPGLIAYLHRFLSRLDIEKAVLAGNSLGGHLALLYTLRNPDSVEALVLSGASGIYEVNIGTSTPRRRDRSFVHERTALTFYDPVHATDELVDEMYDLINDRPRVLRLIRMARSTESETVTDQLATIHAPSLLIWGRNDTITPPNVAEEFRDRLPDARLHFIDECGHAPMIEQPQAFNDLMLPFLREVIAQPTTML